MLILIAISVSLLVIVAGMLLLAKTRKEQLGKLFSAVSYTIVIAGLIILISAFCGGICRMLYSCKGSCQKEYCCASSSGCGYWKKSCSKQGCSHGGKSCKKQKCVHKETVEETLKEGEEKEE